MVKKTSTFILASFLFLSLNLHYNPLYSFHDIFIKEKEILLNTDKLDVGELQAIRIDPNGNILFLDTKGSQLLMFNQEGIFIKRIGAKGQGPGEFMIPFGMGIDKRGNIIVSDSQSRRINKYNKDGNFVTSFIISGLHGAPNIICTDSKDNYFLGAFRFDPDKPGSGGGLFINKYDPNGKYLKSFYPRNEGPLWILNVSPFAHFDIDSDDTIFASQIDRYDISVFNSEGTLLNTFSYSPSYFRAPDSKLEIDYSKYKTKAELFKKFEELSTSWTKIGSLWLIKDKYLLIELEINRLIKGIENKFMLDIRNKNGELVAGGIPTDYKFLCPDKEGFLYFLENSNEEVEEKEPKYAIGKYKMAPLIKGK